MTSANHHQVRWTLAVPKSVDRALRTHLRQTGARRGAMSSFVADAVRRQLSSLNVSAARARNADVPPEQLEREIEQALDEVRQERFAKRR